MRTPLEVPRRPDLRREEFRRDFEFPERPVLVPGSLLGSPALSRWTSDYLIEKGGAEEVLVRVHALDEPQLVTDGPMADFFHYEKMPFGACIQEITSAMPRRRNYLDGWPIDTTRLPGLRDDVRSPVWCPLHMRYPDLLVCGAGTSTPLHIDRIHVVLGQVVGEKRLLLFPPEDGRKFATFMGRHFWNASPLDVTNPDGQRWPRIQYAQPMQCVLRPGDAIFIPARWWHFAEASTFAISIAFWWNRVRPLAQVRDTMWIQSRKVLASAWRAKRRLRATLARSGR